MDENKENMTLSPMPTRTRRRKLPLRSAAVRADYDYSPTGKCDLDQPLSALQDLVDWSPPPNHEKHKRPSPIIVGTPTTDRIRPLTPRSERFRLQHLAERSKGMGALDLSAHSLVPRDLQERFANANATPDDSDHNDPEYHFKKTARNALMRHLFGEDTKAAQPTHENQEQLPPPIPDGPQQQGSWATPPEHLVRRFAKIKKPCEPARKILKSLKETGALNWSTGAPERHTPPTKAGIRRAKRLQACLGRKCRKRRPFWVHSWTQKSR